ncbi:MULTISPECIES: serine aminopeptidase domain-containing protein [Burkholderia]|uniref:serine aminopeptidase domain-containing protein n=1 Tax=Burkholderia TaxID=32008 RepID=UPI00055056F9|nr:MULTISPECIES: alpha/beta hydrolase [Burkholderia]TCT33291.1 serine aminopeptidase S33 family [Burkholderia vietnamiensis]SCZ22654.1 Alpha/beta hydrolase family protein [Burkholderia vietnamiensis]SFX27048.1 Alpha/beta hydrolase family protein [Burkholderia vietnamiensis]
MMPIQFDGCVGWLHAGDRSHGIVICEPLGHEALWLHKLVRSLAEHLAERGFPVLRFHYPASGDSLGDEHDAERFDRMLASVRHAVDALRERVAVDTLSVVGMRAGATLALLAADGIPELTRFVALAPVVRGRGYLRELSLVAQSWLDNVSPAVRDAVRDERPLRVLGHVYPEDLVARLRSINLSECVARARVLPARALVVDAPYGDGSALADALQARGVSVEMRTCADWGGMMREPVWSRLPAGLLDTVVNWIDDGTDGGVRGPLPGAGPGVTLTAQSSVERIVAVEPARMIGVLCEPAGMVRRAAAPTLLIANTATNPRVADGRFAVRLARSLAAAGISSLRIDSTGVGDSGPRATDDQSNIPYSDQAIADVVTAARWLNAHGHREIVAFGICSGAYASLHAAAREQLAGVIAVNLPAFVWPRGQTLADALNNQTNSMRGYWASLRCGRKLRRLLTEGRDLRPVLRAMFRFAAGVATGPLKRVGEHLGWRPGKDTPRGLLRDMSARGIRTHLVYGTFDPGVDVLVRHFGPAAHAFAHLPNVSVDMKDALDHSLHGDVAAQYVVTRCATLLSGWDAPAELAMPAQPEHAPL